MSAAQPFCIPAMPRARLLAMVASLPHAYDQPHSRQHYTTEGFADDFGNIVLPFRMNHAAYLSRYYFYRETA